jgi:mRNA interferase YafQ
MRKIALSDAFLRKLKRFLKIHRDLDKEGVVDFVLEALGKDLSDPLLRTHKLHGKLSGLFACSITYRYRLVFSVKDNIIYPMSIGTHEDVY